MDMNVDDLLGGLSITKPFIVASSATNANDDGSRTFPSNNYDNDINNIIKSRYLIHQTSSTSIYHGSATNNNGNDVGVKIVHLQPSSKASAVTAEVGASVAKVSNDDDDLQRQEQHRVQAARLRLLDELERERRTFDRLPPSIPKRRVIKTETNDDNKFTIHFEWVNGVPLNDWLRPLRQQQRQQLSEQCKIKSHLLPVAIAITKTLSEYHSAGVAHNNLSTSNILLETFRIRKENEEDDAAMNVTVNLIGLSKSISQRDNDGDGIEEYDNARRNDLCNLGRVILVLFGAADDDGGFGSGDSTNFATNETSEDSSSDNHDANYEEERTKRSKSSSAIREKMEGLPLYLVALCSALLANNNNNSKSKINKSNTTTNTSYNKNTYSNSSSSNTNNSNRCSIGEGERYHQIRDVLADLKMAFRKFDAYFRPFDDYSKDRDSPSELRTRLSSAFYGRATEKSMLEESLRFVLDADDYDDGLGGGRSALTVVAGHPGMGKTTLVNQVKKDLALHDGHFIVGKFDKVDISDRPVIFEALDSFFGELLETQDNGRASLEKVERMRKRITDTVGCFIGDLILSIPNLGRLVGAGRTTNIDDANLTIMTGYEEGLATVPKQQLLDRSKFLLCKLVEAIADASHPLVLAFDDLQWVDDTSLSIVQTIFTDPDIKYCLHVVCYRDNDAGAQRVVPMIEDVKSQGVRVSSIKLSSFEKENVNKLVSESMRLPLSLSQPLSEVVHTKTAGLPLFCVNLLSDGMLIRFNLTTRRWEYDIESILTKEIPLSVVQYMKIQMEMLPPSYCLVLKLAACLGHYFDLDTFHRAKIKSHSNLENVLPYVCQIGFLHEISRGKFMWTHEEIRQAAFSLIPQDMRGQFHLLIGSRLLIHTPEKELHQTPASLFRILNHMNKGSELIQTNEQRYDVARLNLMAGEACIKTSSFHSACDYFTRGVKLLPGECWECEYGLAINLHDAAQEAMFVMGDFRDLRLLNAEVIVRAKKFDDKLNSYKILIRYLISLEKTEEAISTCTRILSELGEPIPCPITNQALFHAMMATKKLLAACPGDSILSIQRMADTRKLAAMELLQHILLGSFNSTDPRMGVLILSKMIQMTLEDGLCEASPFAFAMYSSMLVHGTMKDLEGGYYYGTLAIKLVRVFGVRFKVRVFTMVFGMVNIWRDPFQASLGSLLEAYDAGCVTGDIEYTFRCTHIYSELALFTGQNLAILQNNMRTWAKRALQRKQMCAELALVHYLSAVLKLTGDPSKEDVYQTLLNTTENDLFQLLESRNDRRVCFAMLNNRKLFHILMGDMESAYEVYELIINHPIASLNMEHIKTMPYIMGTLGDGLIAFYCARKNDGDNQKWTKKGGEIIETFRTWEKLQKWNFSNKLLMLEAECARTLGEDELAIQKYDASIESAQNHRFGHEQGLANYLCGQFHLAQGRRNEAIFSFSGAKQCYTHWNALALVSQMEQLMANLEMKTEDC